MFLQSPVLNVLETNFSWLKSLVIILDQGDIHGYYALVKNFGSVIFSFKSLAGQSDRIQAKVTYLSFLNMVLRLRPHEREIAFHDINTKCLIDEKNVSDLS